MSAPTTLPVLGPRELLRWTWRQLTSMRTALVLLLLLALAAVPGSVVPQENIEAVRVAQWKADHPDLAPWYERFGLFSVYDSPWFSAIYLLLMVSLVGCIVPRTMVYLRAVRAAPPKAPRNLGRMPAYAVADSDEDAEALRERAAAHLRRRHRYRVVTDTAGGSVSAERGHLREAGNLLFHISVVVVLLAFAYGQVNGYKGGTIVLVGQGFSNSLTQYDDFAPGSLFDPEELSPLAFSVDAFEVEFLENGPNRGQPLDFTADITYKADPGAEPRPYDLKVNHPLVLDDVSVFLVGHGYAPILTVKDGKGQVAYEGPVTFLPQDATFASFGVLKVPDAEPEQLGFDGLFLPTYAFTMERGPFSIYPDALNPALTLQAYYGDLGLDSGAPQSVFDLDTDRMKQFEKADGKPFRLDMAPGKTIELPGGLGSVTFEGWQRWVKLQVSNTPAKGVALGAVVAALVGLMGSLFIRRRRTWVRVATVDGRSRVEVAGLDRGTAGDDLGDEVRSLLDAVLGTGADTGRATDDLPGTGHDKREVTR